MRTYLLAVLVFLSLSACAGLDITPISPADEAASHSGQKNLKGYVVYGPMVVVEVTRKEICNNRDSNGKCTTHPEITCSAGTPFILPDPSKPFLVNIRSGFGKTGIDVAISNGWQLESMKDNSDNTAVLGAIEKLVRVPVPSRTKSVKKSEKSTCKAGLYRVNLTAKGVELTPLVVY